MQQEFRLLKGSAGSAHQPCLGSHRKDAGCGYGGITPGNNHHAVRTLDWHLLFSPDSAGNTASDAAPGRLYGLLRCPAGYPHQVHGGISGGDADADVPYGISIRGILSPAGAACLDEYTGKD